MLSNVDSGRVASVAGVLLKRESEQSDTFTGHGIKQFGNDLKHRKLPPTKSTKTYLIGETTPLPIVDFDDTVPVVCNLAQIQRFTQINQAQNVFLETRAAKA